MAKGLNAKPPKVNRGVYRGTNVAKSRKRPWENKQEKRLRDTVRQGNLDAQQAGNQFQGGAIDQMQQQQDPYGNIADPGNYSGDQMREQMAQQYYQNFMQNEGANQATEREDFEQMAANRGWAPGSEIYNQEKSRLEKSQNQARENALFTGYTSGGQEGRADYGTSVAGMAPRANMASTKRYSGVADTMATRGMAPDNSQYQNEAFQGYEAAKNRAAAGRMGGGGGGYQQPTQYPSIPAPTTGGGGPDWGGMLTNVGTSVLGSLAKNYLPQLWS